MREISQERLIKDTKRVLENPFWIPDLVSGKGYRRREKLKSFSTHKAMLGL